MSAAQPAVAPKKFRFDRQLWQRFVEVAQPYFYPPGPRSSAQFLFLVLNQLVFVVAFTFFFIVVLALLGFQFVPQFFEGFAKEIIYLKFLGGLGNTPAEILQGLTRFVPFYIFLALILMSAGIFFAYRHKLKGREKQWSILGVLLFLSFIVSSLNVLISYVFRFIDNALNKKDPAMFWSFLTVYGITLVVAIPILVGYSYARQKLSLFWRSWLTTTFLDGYFQNRAYYELDSNAANTGIDNPDQRITEDIKSFTITVLDLLLDVLSSVLDLVAFVGILYIISQSLTLGLVGYVAIGTALAVVIGTKLIQLNFDQLRLEGDFRYGMVHVRDNAESIAFYQGEKLERNQVEGRLGKAIKNYDLLIIWFAFLNVFQSAYKYFARLVPYIIVAPLYFAGKVDFGTIGQGIFAFSMVLDAMSVITNRIKDIAAFSASIERLGTLFERFGLKVDHADNDYLRYSPAERIKNLPFTHFKIDQLTLRTPNAEQTLFQNLSFELESSQSLLVVGASGRGKSSLLRAIAGLWRNGSGTIESPDFQEALFLPQTPYMLLGSLREQLVYPNRRPDITDQEIQTALTNVNLADLIDRMAGLDNEKDWATVLSIGEQQRLAFARILLSRPKYVILDEATSALDVTNERRLYEMLQGLDITYISVGHRPSLVDYHQRVLDLGAANGWQLLEAKAYQFAQ
jgi:vitamin B12/bleomycin/antimicrobial peptide transport system ATP-binding/permease protein